MTMLSSNPRVQLIGLATATTLAALIALFAFGAFGSDATGGPAPLERLLVETPNAPVDPQVKQAVDAGPVASLPADQRQATAMSGFVNGKAASVEAVAAPADLAPAAGEAKTLASNVGGTGVDVHAWADGSQVCISNGTGGGCFSEFSDAALFNATVSDPDQVGAGKPLTVWGVVPDEVASVTVMLDGVASPAAVENNAVVWVAPSAGTLPFELEAFVVELKDGSKQIVDP